MSNVNGKKTVHHEYLHDLNGQSITATDSIDENPNNYDHHNHQSASIDEDILWKILSEKRQKDETTMMNDENKFCGGMMMMQMNERHKMGGMAMYMDGFRSSFAHPSQTPCINILFPSWTLDSRGKFIGAMAGVILLAIFTEAVSSFRLRVHGKMNPGLTRKLITILLHGLQAFLGYILMMITMTFSIELLLCVCLGLGVGYFLFFDDKSGAKHVTTNPCCTFMEGEATEVGSVPDVSQEQQQPQEITSLLDDQQRQQQIEI